MIKNFLIIALIAPLLALSACKEEAKVPQEIVKEELKPSAYRIVIESQSGQSHAFNVELALTPQEQAKGLMNRPFMKEDAGMLFYFGEEREQAFWMKNTLIPLDIIYIKQSGRIHHIHENAIPGDLTPIPSKGVVSGVLEINGGLSRKLAIQPGDIIKHHFFTPNPAQ